MWLITPFGFFSIVDKDPTGQGRLCVRARVEDDLSRLRDKYLPELSATERSQSTDYEYRAYGDREVVSRAVSQMALDIDYPNMKAAAELQLGIERELIYTRAWSALLALKPRGRFPSYNES